MEALHCRRLGGLLHIVLLYTFLVVGYRYTNIGWHSAGRVGWVKEMANARECFKAASLFFQKHKSWFLSQSVSSLCHCVVSPLSLYFDALCSVLSLGPMLTGTSFPLFSLVFGSFCLLVIRGQETSPLRSILQKRSLWYREEMCRIYICTMSHAREVFTRWKISYNTYEEQCDGIERNGWVHNKRSLCMFMMIRSVRAAQGSLTISGA